MAGKSEQSSESALPPAIEKVREAALEAIEPLEPAGAPQSQAETKGLILSSRTDGGRDLPPYYLVYFLLVDLLGFPKLGRWEKVAWTIPVRYSGRLYAVEHRKMGLGIFAPTLDENATASRPPSEEAENDAREIAALIRKAVRIAEPYFEWCAEQAAGGAKINVINNCSWLFDRYVFFRDRFKELSAEVERRKNERTLTERTLDDGTVVTIGSFPVIQLRREAEWTAQAAVEAFFSWTEHAFIHLAILQGYLLSGADVAEMAESDWKAKFKTALDLNDAQTKEHYDKLLDLRAQIRNFMAHGAFGKRGEAFHFHSGAGAVPVLLTGSQKRRYSLSGEPAFDERWAIGELESFLTHLRSGPYASAQPYLFSSLPSILTYAIDGTYSGAMESVESMTEFVEYLTQEFDNAANMDW